VRGRPAVVDDGVGSDFHRSLTRAKAAVAALDRAMDRLERPKRTDHLSDDARASLTYQVRTVLDMLS
jgi:hypothetical protein